MNILRFENDVVVSCQQSKSAMEKKKKNKEKQFKKKLFRCQDIQNITEWFVNNNVRQAREKYSICPNRLKIEGP